MLDIDAPPADLSSWNDLVYALQNPQHSITISMVGKYTELTEESYKSLTEALLHAGAQTATKVNIEYIDATELEQGKTEVLEG